MIRHVVLFRFREEADEDAVEALLDELATFPARFDEILTWEQGENTSTRSDMFTHGFVASFDDRASLDRYLGSEAHEAFVAGPWRAIVADRAIASFEV